MLNKSLIAGLALIFLNFSSIVYANEKRLLSESIKIIVGISPDTDIKDKLDSYEKALSKLDAITDKFASTEIGINLLTDQKVGKFDPVKLRADYLKLLFEYQDIVCEKTPSYLCLGYVSLKLGVEQCKKPKNWGQLLRGHKSLLNTQKIFYGQKANRRHQRFALTAYRSCGLSSYTVGRDYFSYLLIEQLLRQKKKKLAKGIIQKIKTPHYKFMGILKLTEASGKKVNKKYVKRLVEYYNKKLKGFGVKIAQQEFLMFYIKNAKSKLLRKQDIKRLREKLKVRFSRSARTSGGKCLPWYQTAGFNQELKFRKNIFNTKSKTGGVKHVRSFFPSAMLDSKPAGGSFYGPCAKVGKPYELGLELFTDILFEKGIKESEKFAHYLNSGSRSNANILDYYMGVMIKEPSEILGMSDDDGTMESIEKKLRDPSNKVTHFAGKLEKEDFKRCKKDIERALDKYEEHKNDRMRGKMMKRMLEGTMSSCGIKATKASGRATALTYVKNFKMGSAGYHVLFKKLVDFDQICPASDILFKNINKNSKYFSKSINYMISSPVVDPSKTYKCGDAELETLLN